jgi:hypothetical protein
LSNGPWQLRHSLFEGAAAGAETGAGCGFGPEFWAEVLSLAEKAKKQTKMATAMKSIRFLMLFLIRNYSPTSLQMVDFIETCILS